MCIFFIIVIALFSPSTSNHRVESTIPKQIWTYWDSDNIPIFVKDCISTWYHYNPSWKITILNNSNLQSFLPSVNILKYRHADSPARISDFIRLHVLEKYGGVWMDATLLCSTPLDWVLSFINTDFVGYYISSYTTDAKYPIIESWFLAAPQNSPFIKDWNREFLRMNTFDTVKDYINDLRQKHVNLQNIDLPEYLAIHCACQRILQNPSSTYQYHVTSAEQGPYKYKYSTGPGTWDTDKGLERLCQHPENYMMPIVKFTGWERKRLIEHPLLADCIIRNAKIAK